MTHSTFSRNFLFAFIAMATSLFFLSVFKEYSLNYIIWSRVLAVLIFESVAALAVYFIARQLFRVQAFTTLAVGACFLGLIVGWTGGYRIEKDVTAQSLYESENRSYRLMRGTDMPNDVWLSVLSQHMYNNSELEYYLHKRAAAYSIPPFIIVLFIILRLAKRHEFIGVNKPDEEVVTEKVLREADARAVEESRRKETHRIFEEKQQKQNEEFIALLKSAINENILETVPNEELLEICKQARLINYSRYIRDVEFSQAMNKLSEEIKKRGLSQENMPQKISNYADSSFKENKKADGIHTIPIIVVITTIIVVIALAVISSDKEKVGQKEAAVSESTDLLKATQEVAEKRWKESQRVFFTDNPEYFNERIKHVAFVDAVNRLLATEESKAMTDAQVFEAAKKECDAVFYPMGRLKTGGDKVSTLKNFDQPNMTPKEKVQPFWGDKNAVARRPYVEGPFWAEKIKQMEERESKMEQAK